MEDERALTETERFAWGIEMMVRASKAREQYLRSFVRSINQVLKKETFQFSRESGAPQKNRILYGSFHVDLIFRVISIIESFHGTLAAAWEFSTEREPDLAKVFSILINPNQREYSGHKGGVFEKLKKRNLSEETLCRFTVFPMIKNLRNTQVFSGFLRRRR